MFQVPRGVPVDRVICQVRDYMLGFLYNKGRRVKNPLRYEPTLWMLVFRYLKMKYDDVYPPLVHVVSTFFFVWVHHLIDEGGSANLLSLINHNFWGSATRRSRFFGGTISNRIIEKVRHSKSGRELLLAFTAEPCSHTVVFAIILSWTAPK